MSMRDYLILAAWWLQAGDHEGGDRWYYEQALRNLRLALGAAKHEGNGFAAGRILTALRFARQCGVPRQDIVIGEGVGL